MSDVWEYRTTVSEGPLAASQLNQEFGAEGWELVTMFMWPHGEVDSETGRLPDRIWSYFKREKRPIDKPRAALWEKKPADESTVPIISGASSMNNGSTETAQGTDEVGVQKSGPAKVVPIKNKEKGR